MLPRILLFLALAGTVIGLSVSVFRGIARRIDRRRSMFAARSQDNEFERMGPAEREFRSRELARRSKTTVRTELAGGVALTVLGGYGTIELIGHLATQSFAEFLKRDLTFVLFAAPAVLGYGIYLTVANTRELKKRRGD